MRCQNCGFTNLEGKMFCWECGALLVRRKPYGLVDYSILPTVYSDMFGILSDVQAWKEKRKKSDE